MIHADLKSICVHNTASLLKAVSIFLFKFVPIDAFEHEHARVTFSVVGKSQELSGRARSLSRAETAQEELVMEEA